MSKIGRDGLSVEMDIGRDGKQSRWKSVDMVSVEVETGRGDPTPIGLPLSDLVYTSVSLSMHCLCNLFIYNITYPLF